MRDYKRIQNKYTIAFGLMVLLVFTGSVSVAGASVKTGIYPGNSFIDPTVVINVKNFSLGSESYIAPFTSFTGEYVYIGNYSNIQDGGSNSGKIRIEDDAVVAHGADLIGEVEIGSKAFIGFNSLIKDSKIGEGAYIGIGSKIIGVNIPAHKSVPTAATIDSIDDLNMLEPVTTEQEEFVNEVIEVNRALATGYGQLFKKSGAAAFGKIGPNGGGDVLIDGKDILSFNGNHEPTVGEGAVIGKSRIIGYVILGNNVRIGDRTSIRGDEGVPISIGDNATIEKNDTFHSLNDKQITIGNNFELGSDSVIHGPLSIGNSVRIGSRAVIYKSTIGDNVAIGDNAIVMGVKVPGGAIIPSGSIVTTQKDVRTFNTGAQPEESEPASISEIALIAFIPMALGLMGSYILRNK